MAAEDDWDVAAAVQFISDNNSRNVALQFPHDLISLAHTILRSVKDGLSAIGWSGNVFLLADIARHGSTVDIVAADHLQADAIVQFGAASREPVSSRPVFHVLRKQACSVDSLLRHVKALASSTGKRLVVILDTPYAHFQEQLSEASSEYGVQVCKTPFEVLQRLAGLPAAGSPETYGNTVTGDGSQHRLWIGAQGSTTLDYALIACGTTDWSFLDPLSDTVSDEVPAAKLKMLMRRRFLTSKAEGATIVGILISTVAIDGWKDVLQSIKALAGAVGKKTYTIFLGKPAPEKLANFPEVEVWVQISDPAGFVWESKPYLAPVVAPAEAVQAWQPLLADLTEHSQEAEGPDDGAVEVHARQRGALTARAAGTALTKTTPQNAAEYFLQKRTFTGVETPATGAAAKPVEAAAPGLRGRAALYDTEPPH